jgi:hypothetical protein
MSMGKQVNFFMMGEDEQQFAEFILQDRRVVFVPEVAQSKPIPQFRSLEEADRTNYPQALLIWNRGIGRALTVKQYGAGNVRVDKANDAVIEFHRSILHNGKVLVAGRIWAEMVKFDEDRIQTTYKGKDFERWFDSIARWLRTEYEREAKYGIYIGHQAKRLAETGQIQLATLL